MAVVPIRIVGDPVLHTSTAPVPVDADGSLPADLAGLIADDAKMTKEDLGRWLAKATHAPLGGSTVAWVAAGSPHGWELALEWIESKNEFVGEAGWSTLSCLVSLKDDSELDLAELKRLLQRVEKTIGQAPNAARYAMNSFVPAMAA